MSEYDDALAKSVYTNALAGASAGPTAWLTTATPFNGTSEFVDTSVALNSLGSDYAICVWGKVAAGEVQTATDNTVFSQGGEALFLLWGHSTAGYRGAVGVRTGAGTYFPGGGPITISANEWHHFAGVHTGGTTYTLIDGVVVASVAQVPGSSLSLSIRFAGRSSGDRNFKGDMSQALVLDGGTAADIAALYAGPTSALRRGLTLSITNQLTATL